MTEFKTNTGAVNGWGRQFDGVTSDVGSFINCAPGIAGVLNSHGTIGHPMQTEFDGAQAARGGAMGATQAASAKIGELLREAAQAYERGDVAAAGRLKAQADQMDGSGGPASSSATAAAGAAGGGSQAATQMMGQFGQVAGQLAQSLTQPIQGVAQGLGQMPQQVFQGVQGIVQTATRGAGAEGAEAGTEAAAKASAAGAEGAGDAGRAPTGSQDHTYTPNITSQ